MQAFTHSVLFALFLAIFTPALAAEGKTWGFVGELMLKRVKVEGSNSSFELLDDFEFVDLEGRTWGAPKGTIVDGASIPQFFWSFIGGPWSGEYAPASVMHDHFCTTKSRHWQDVHRMFYEAMRANGVDEILAKIMYFAVYRFGPRWTDTVKHFYDCVGKYYGYSGPEFDTREGTDSFPEVDILEASRISMCAAVKMYAARLVWHPTVNEGEAESTIEQIESRNLSIEEIESLADNEIHNNVQQALEYGLYQVDESWEELGLHPEPGSSDR